MRWNRRPRAVKAEHDLAAATAAGFRHRIAVLPINFDAEQRIAIESLAGSRGNGFYLHGDVGRGKSVLAESYFASIPTTRKIRVHFHDFFRELHARIVQSRRPIDATVRDLLDGSQAVLFDEFHVHDVADGVYLTSVLRVMIERGVLILATSNYAPEQLMPNPLYHDGFLPAIDMIRGALDVIAIGPGPDYRRPSRGDASGFRSGTWSITSPSLEQTTHNAEANLAGHVVPLSLGPCGEVTFTFGALCEKPLGSEQYLALAENYRTIRIDGVPDLATAERDPSARFADLVDIFYDRDVRMHVASTAGPERLLDSTTFSRDARRTVSRLSALSQPQRGLTNSG